jgi:hypothetical protein
MRGINAAESQNSGFVRVSDSRCGEKFLLYFHAFRTIFVINFFLFIACITHRRVSPSFQQIPRFHWGVRSISVSCCWWAFFCLRTQDLVERRLYSEAASPLFRHFISSISFFFHFPFHSSFHLPFQGFRINAASGWILTINCICLYYAVIHLTTS